MQVTNSGGATCVNKYQNASQLKDIKADRLTKAEDFYGRKQFKT